MSSRTLRKTLTAGAALWMVFGLISPASAQDSGDVGVEILQLLVDEGIVPADKAQQIMAKAEARAAARVQTAAANASNTIDVTYVPEAVRAQIKEEVKGEIMTQAKTEGWMAPNALPDWAERIKISGDFRVRDQSEMFDEGNFPFFPDVNAINKAGGVTDAAGFPLLNSTHDRHRDNYRARLNVEAQVTNRVKVGVRLATGSDSSAVSTNTTFGDNFQKDAVWIDQAYVQLTPLKGLAVTAGRMPNPFYATDMIWDADINPEGIAFSGRHDFGYGQTSVFGTLAAMPLQERELYDDSNLFAAQLGAEHRFSSAWSAKAALGFYDFSNVQSLKNPADGSKLNDWSAPRTLAKGNSIFNMRTDGLTTLAGLASKFELVTLTGEIGFGEGPRRYRLKGELVQNVAMNKDQIAALRGEPGVEPGNLGWNLRLDAGYPQITAAGQWRVAAGYKHVETDAVLDIFTDSDFGLGGTDVEGYVLEGEYGIYKNTSVGLTWYSTDSIKRPPFAIDTLQLNLNTKF